MGILREACSALLAVGETDTYDPIIETDETGEIHWSGNDYVLVVNGDLIDRGPDSEACLTMIWRLLDETPAGRVLYLIGNHELPILMPQTLGWPGTYSTELAQSQRRKFLERIVDGDVRAAYEGYNYIYSHAGSNEIITPQTVNENLREAAATIVDELGMRSESSIHDRLIAQYDQLFALGENGGRGPSAGLCWLDFKYLEETAPPQIMGHSMRRRAVRKGNVVCGNVIRRNHRSKGGEGVLVENPEKLTFVWRDRNGTVRTETV